MKALNENSHPFFSVVIPVYNNIENLKKAVYSIFDQSYQDFEIIIIDDFSSNQHLVELFVSSLGDSRVRLFKNEKNMNGAYSRNLGITMANGEYICFLDCDDTWLPTKLESVKARALNNVGLIVHKVFVRNQNGEVKTSKDFAYGVYLLAERIFCKGELMQTGALTVRADIAKVTLFNETLRRHQDYNFLVNLQSLVLHSSCFINEALSFWNIDTGICFTKKGASSAVSRKWIELDGHLISPSAKASFCCLEFAQMLILEKKYSEALITLISEIRHVPFSNIPRVFVRSFRNVMKVI